MTGTTVSRRIRMKWDADWDREVLKSAEARKAAIAVADAGAAAAKRLAPVLSGDYQKSIEAVATLVSGVYVGSVVAVDFKAVWIERGATSPTYTTPAQHVLQRGVESTGVKVGPGSGRGIARAGDPGPSRLRILALGWLVCVIAAVLIGIRNARSKGRRSAIAEADEVEALLADCREGRLTDAAALYRLREALASRGIDPP